MLPPIPMQGPYKHWSRAWNHMHRILRKHLIITVPNLKEDHSLTPPQRSSYKTQCQESMNNLKTLCLLHAIACEMFKNLQPTNNSDPDHQGPPTNLDCSGISHQVSPPPNSSSSGICQQESAPLFSDVIETYPQVSASPDQNSSEISHQVLALDSDQKSTGEGGEPNEPKEPDEPIQEVSWHDIPCVCQEPDQNRKTETEVPIQEVSWYAIPGVPENEIPPNSPNSDNSQINLKCITWKNEEQEPQADSVKSYPTNIMMSTMPTQKRFNLTKAKGKGQRQKGRRKMYYFGKHISKVSQRCYPQSSSKLSKLTPFTPLTRYYQLAAIHLIQEKLRRAVSPICLMTRDKKP